MTATLPTVAVSIPTFARAFGISKRWAYELVKRGEVRSFELAGKRLVPVTELERISGVRIEAGHLPEVTTEPGEPPG